MQVVTDRINPSMLCYANEVTLLAEGVLQAFVLWNYGADIIIYCIICNSTYME